MTEKLSYAQFIEFQVQQVLDRMQTLGMYIHTLPEVEDRLGDVFRIATPEAAWDPASEPARQAQYLDKHGTVCPACGARTIESENPETDGPTATLSVSCRLCRSTWTNIYTLTSFEKLEGPEDEPIS